MAWITNTQELKDYFGLNMTLIGKLAVDVATVVQPDDNWECTHYPLETGAEVSQARIKKPITLTLDCILTNPDLSAESAGRNALAGTFNFSTWQDKRNKLYEYADKDEVIEVRADGRVYPNMVIKKVTPDRRVSTALAFFVRVEMEEFNFVESEITQVSESQIPKEKKEKKKPKHSNKDNAKKEIEHQGKKQPSSLASDIVRGLVKVLGG